MSPILRILLVAIVCAQANSAKSAANATPPPPEPPPVVYNDAVAAPPPPPVIYSDPEPAIGPEIKLLTQDQWLNMEVVQTTKAEIGPIYQDLLAKRLIDTIETKDTMTPAETANYEEAKKIAIDTSKRGFLSLYDRFVDNRQDQWLFVGEDGAEVPNVAANLTFPTPESYLVKVRIYCIEQNAECSKAIETFKSLPAPQVPKTHSKKAFLEWLLIRTEGPCTTKKPFNMSDPVYPLQEAADNIGGVTRLRIRTDACGFPLEVYIDKSSRNRNLDRAAITAAWRWRVEMPEEIGPHKRGVPRQAIVPVQFTPTKKP